MREIKFRAWDKSAKEWIYSVNNIVRFFELVYGHSTPNEFEHPQQFTGLYDKAGKEIYESDIVRYNTGETWIVRWANRNASFEYVSNMKGDGRTQILGSHEVEVIGNIMEHKYLLEKNDDSE